MTWLHRNQCILAEMSQIYRMWKAQFTMQRGTYANEAGTLMWTSVADKCHVTPYPKACYMASTSRMFTLCKQTTLDVLVCILYRPRKKKIGLINGLDLCRPAISSSQGSRSIENLAECLTLAPENWWIVLPHQVLGLHTSTYVHTFVQACENCV